MNFTKLDHMRWEAMIHGLRDTAGCRCHVKFRTPLRGGTALAILRVTTEKTKTRSLRSK